MALFKVSQGPSNNLNTQALTEGFCWFTPDDGKFYIDAYKNSVLTRIALNAAHADTATTATTAAGVSGIIPVEHGGTGANNAGTARTNLGLGSMATEVAADYIKKSTLSGAFDVMYSSAANTPARLAANTTTTKKFLSMTGTGSAGKAPTWETVTKNDVGLSNVTNHAQVTAVTWDSTNKKLQQSVSGGTATDIVTIGTIKTALNLTKADVALGNVPNVNATNASNISSGTLSADRLPTTGVTSSSASFGPSANASPAHQAGFTVPYFTVDKYGRITAASNITITLPPDNNVTQTNSTSNKDYRIILSGTNDDTTRVEGTNKSTNLRFNPSTKILSVGGSISATGDLTVTGDTNLNSDTTIASATVGALEVTGNATFTQIPQSVTPAASSNDNSIATTAFVKSGIAGLAGAMHFRGITTTNITDGSTTDPLISGYNFSTDKLAGDVVIDSNSSYEYVWAGAKWERLGPDGSYKVVQSAVTAPTAVTNKWVSSIGQDANGVISANYSTLDTSGAWAGTASNVTGIVAIANGGTGASNAGTARTNLGLGSMATEVATDYIKKSTLSGAYDIMYSSAANTPARLAANTTTTRKFLRMKGTGSAGAAPEWDTVTKSDVGLSNVTNHAQVTAVTWDTDNKKLQQSVSGGTATDIVTIGTIKTALALTKADVGLSNVPNVNATNASNITSGTLSADRLATSGVTADSYGPSTNASPAHAASFSVPYITVDNKGRVTAASTKTITLPPDSDTKVTQTNITATTSADYRILLSASTNDTTETNTSNKNTNLRFNTGTKTLSVGGNIIATGDLTLTGDAYLNNNTYAAGITTDSLIVNGSARFNQIPTSITPEANSNDTSVATTAFVVNAFSANDAMVFKGVVNANGDLPVNHKQGWTYKIGTAGTYAGQVCEVGDTIYCVTDGTSANNAHWVVVQNNIDGAVYRGSNSMTNTAVVIADGTAGKVKSSGVLIDSSNNMSIPAKINLTGTDSSTAVINFSRTGANYPNYINIPSASTFAVSVGGTSGTNIRLAVQNDAIHSWTTDTVDLGTSSIKWKNVYAGTFYGALSGNASSATKAGVASMWMYPENSNEINFGGNTASSTIYMGYRAKDSKAIPSKFVFGDSTGTADLQAKTVYLGSGTTSYVSSTQYTGNAATANKVNHSLTLANNRSFDGSADVTLLTNDLTPMCSHTYTELIGSANSTAGAAFYFGKIRPTSWDKVWCIKYRIHVYVSAYPSYDQVAEIILTGSQASLRAYSSFNTIGANYPAYYNNLWRLKSAGYSSGYSHIVGVDFANSQNPTSTNYKRTVVVDVFDTENCTFEFYDSCKKENTTDIPELVYTNGAYTNYDGRTQINFSSNGLQETGDSNTITQNAIGYSSSVAQEAIYRYQILLRAKDGKLIPVSSANNSITADNATTFKTYSSSPFDPFGEIYYWYSTSTISANGNVGNSLYRQVLADLRYAFDVNTTTHRKLVARQPVYLTATLQNDSSAILTIPSESIIGPLTQTLPTTDDGLIYIYLGQAYEDSNPYRVELLLHHTVYKYIDGAVREISPNSVYANNAGAVPWSGITSKPTTIAGYGITDAKIENGTITLGSNTITPLTSHQDISDKVSKSGDSMTGNLTLTAASGNSPALIFQRDGSLTDWKIFVTGGRLSFQSSTDNTNYTERASFADNSGDFTVGSLTANNLTASYAVVTDSNKKLVSRGIRNNTSIGALGWTSNSTDTTLVTTNTITYWNGAYSSTSSNLKYSANGEIMGLSTAQTVSATKTFSAIQKFTNTTDSSYSQDTTAAVSISGGLSVAKRASVKELRVDNNQSAAGASFIYNTTNGCLEIIV